MTWLGDVTWAEIRLARLVASPVDEQLKDVISRELSLTSVHDQARRRDDLQEELERSLSLGGSVSAGDLYGFPAVGPEIQRKSIDTRS